MEVYGIFSIVNGFQMCTDNVGKVTFLLHTLPYYH